MSVGWGADSTVSGGTVTSGTTASDVRKVWGALYTPGIVQGCTITRSGSAMTYSVASGVVAIKTGSKEAIMAPVEATTVTTAAAPGTGSRVDLIYAEQRLPAAGDSTVQVKVAAFANNDAVVVPANSVELRRYQVSAGQTNTNAAVQVGGVNYSIPYGANLGVLHEWQNTYTGPLSIPLIREGNGYIDLPTDRRVRFSLNAVLYVAGANGFDNSKYTEHFFLPNVDGNDMVIWTTPGLHQAWGTYNWEHYINLPAGRHPVNLGAGRMVGPGQASTYYGLDGLGFGRRGIYFLVEDAGPTI